MRFKKIPQDTFNEMQMDAGILLSSFNPETPNVQDADIITATTGGINVVCQPSFSDFGEDIDNCPNNTKELKHLDEWDCRVSTTSLSTSVAVIKRALGAADVTDNKITPRRDLEQSDFADLWYVGDKAGGGFVACRVINALSTGGLSLQTGKNAKGQITLEFTGHVSINDQDTMPMEFYSSDN